MLSKSEAKYIQSLSQKKYRLQENLFVAEGPKIIEEALNNTAVKIKKVFAVEEWMEAHKKHAAQYDVATITQNELERISQLKTPNQVVALIEMNSNDDFVLKKEKLALALDGIQDPGNMGTIVRIADWFGIEQIICSTDCADIYNSKVVQASMGSIFRVQVFYTELANWLASQTCTTIYGAALNGSPLKSYNKVQKGIVVIGNESKGIRQDVMQQIAQKITIAKIGRAESLNAAVATGIILSHII